ncbi:MULTISPECIES: hypothetical protein [unclassified Streptomyces]|uniref:hypothetical protein n=1 Tax=unclassified Streptomyces TaxID=2593676 RepID=UPI004040EE6E
MARIEERLPGTAVVTDPHRQGVIQRRVLAFLSMAWPTTLLWLLHTGFTMLQRFALVVSSVVFPLGYRRLRRLDEPSHTRADIEVRLPSDGKRAHGGARVKTRTTGSAEWDIKQQGLIGYSVLFLAGVIGIVAGAYVKGEPRLLHDGGAAFFALAAWSAWTSVRIRLLHRSETRGSRTPPTPSA